MTEAPELLTDEGEVVFVRGDLAMSAPEARNAASIRDFDVAGMEVDVVSMAPDPKGVYEWVVVADATPDAVRFWRFRL